MLPHACTKDFGPRDKVHRERKLVPSAGGSGGWVKLVSTSPAIPSHHPRQRQPKIAKRVVYLDVLSTSLDATVTRLPIVLPGTMDSSFSCNRHLSRRVCTKERSQEQHRQGEVQSFDNSVLMRGHLQYFQKPTPGSDQLEMDYLSVSTIYHPRRPTR
ncbi:hypothetical protein EDB83DRAFT_1224810 [Lactarius deliciosus]|nr:hypothetical protein EDB83DRAFT_1224810 [Lactarius deliciosus]